MKKPSAAVGLLLALACAPPPAPPVAGAFTASDREKLFSRKGAESQAQILYHCFKPARDPALVCPAWLEAALPTMSAVLLEEDGERLTEGDLWRAAPAVQYEFYELVRRRFPARDGGRDAAPASFAAEHQDNAERCAITARNLEKVPSASLAGRGAGLRSAYGRACEAMARAALAAKAGDEDRYRKAALDAAEATEAAYGFLNR